MVAIWPSDCGQTEKQMLLRPTKYPSLRADPNSMYTVSIQYYKGLSMLSML